MDQEDAKRYLNQALHGLWRIHPVYLEGVNPLEPDENFVRGFELVRGGRRVYVDLTDLSPDDARAYRRALVHSLSTRIASRISPFLESDGSFRDDVTITPVMRNGKPVQLVISRPGSRPLRISARDFLGLVQALRDKNEVLMHGKLQTSSGAKDFWLMGNRRVMEVLGHYVQQGQLPLDFFSQRGNVLVLNADSIEQPLFQKKVKFKKVKYVPKSIWGWSP